ncbi:MAG: hypothetical protein ACLU4N_19795 [Butyricimonas faecihominis]
MQGLKARIISYAKQMDKAAEGSFDRGAQESKKFFPLGEKNDINLVM